MNNNKTTQVNPLLDIFLIIFFVLIFNNNNYSIDSNLENRIFDTNFQIDTIIENNSNQQNIKSDSAGANKQIPQYEKKQNRKSPAPGDSLNGDDRDPDQGKDTIPHQNK